MSDWESYLRRTRGASAPIEEAAHERCACGEFNYAPKTWRAIARAGIQQHLPGRMGGCASGKVAAPEPVPEVAVPQPPAPPAPEEKPMEAATAQAPAPENSTVVGGNGVTKHRRPDVQRYAVTTAEGTREIWMADGKMRAVEFAWAAHVNKSTAMRLLEDLGEKPLHEEWPLWIGEARKLVGKPIQLITKRQADAVVKAIAQMETSFKAGTSGRKIHSRNKHSRERISLSYVTRPARTKPRRMHRRVRHEAEEGKAGDSRPERVTMAGDVVEVYDGLVPLTKYLNYAMGGTHSGEERTKLLKLAGIAPGTVRAPGGGRSGAFMRKMAGITVADAQKLNELGPKHIPRFQAVELVTAGRARSPYAPGGPVDRLVAGVEKATRKAEEPRARAQKEGGPQPPPFSSVADLRGLKASLQASAIRRLVYDRDTGKFDVDMGISL